jgi:hypothetical protein
MMPAAVQSALRVFAVVAAITVAAGCIDEDLINPMAARQPRVQPYVASGFYDDGLAMRAPPAGTVPRERIVMSARLTTGIKATIAAPADKPGSAPQSVYVTTFPLRVDRALIELGRKRFDITCATCHGPVGDGDSIVARQMALRPPPSLHLYADRPVGYLYEVITKGFGMMANYAAELSVRERWAVVAYVRALQLSQASPIDRAPPAVRARLLAEAASEPSAAPPARQETHQ